MRLLKWAVVVTTAVAMTGLAAPAKAAVQGDGFTEFIMSCTGDSNTIMDLTKGRAVMIRVAPECDPMEPIVFKATKKRTLRLTASHDGEISHHTVRVWVRR